MTMLWQSCPELLEILKVGRFDELKQHLDALVSLYSIDGDKYVLSLLWYANWYSYISSDYYIGGLLYLIICILWPGSYYQWRSKSLYTDTVNYEITRYAHHILSVFDIFSCNWIALGPDNAPDHTSAQALAAILNAGFELLRHPPYLPFVFVLHGKWLAGRQEQQFFYNGIRALEKCWTMCILVAWY